MIAKACSLTARGAPANTSISDADTNGDVSGPRRQECKSSVFRRSDALVSGEAPAGGGHSWTCIRGRLGEADGMSRQ